MNKKSYEKYVARLIKESEHRVLNEYELLTLINYTEGIWGERIGRGLARLGTAITGYGTADPTVQPQTPIFTDADAERMGATTPEEKERLMRDAMTKYQDDLNAYNYTNDMYNRRQNLINRAGEIGSHLGDTLYKYAGDPLAGAWNKYVKTPTTQWAHSNIVEPVKQFGQTMSNPKTYTGALKKAAVGLANIGQGKNIGVIDGQVYVLDNLGNKKRLASQDEINQFYSRAHPSQPQPTVPQTNTTTTMPNQPRVQRTSAMPTATVRQNRNSLRSFRQPTSRRGSLTVRPTLASESYVVKSGKRIKQKPVLTDLQEQLLLYYLKKVNNN